VGVGRDKERLGESGGELEEWVGGGVGRRGKGRGVEEERVGKGREMI